MVLGNQGTFAWPDGERYVGEWKDENLLLRKIYLSNGDKWHREYKNGKKYGQGTYYYLNNQYKGGKNRRFDEKKWSGTFSYPKKNT